MTREMLKNYIKNIPDFPKPGIMFKDISGLLYNPEAYNLAIQLLTDHIESTDLIVSPGARGFLFGPPVAIKKNLPFVMIRKKGKLPGTLKEIDYESEYSQNSLEIIDKQIQPGNKVVIIDDVLATGETVNAIIKLVQNQGGVVVSVLFLLTIADLNGTDNINLDNKKIKSLLKF